MQSIGKLILFNGISKEQHVSMHLGWVPDYDLCLKASGASRKFIAFWRANYRPGDDAYKQVVIAFALGRKNRRLARISKATATDAATLRAWKKESGKDFFKD